jgi:hypothetical protein
MLEREPPCVNCSARGRTVAVIIVRDDFCETAISRLPVGELKGKMGFSQSAGLGELSPWASSVFEISYRHIDPVFRTWRLQHHTGTLRFEASRAIHHIAKLA